MLRDTVRGRPAVLPEDQPLEEPATQLDVSSVVAGDPVVRTPERSPSARHIEHDPFDPGQRSRANDAQVLARVGADEQLEIQTRDKFRNEVL